MTGRLCLDCIWAISSDSVALFVSHCDKVLWLSIIIPSRSEGSFPNSIFQLSRSYSRHKKCMKKNNNKKTAPQLGCVFIFEIISSVFCLRDENKKHSPATPHVIDRCIQAHLRSTHTLQLCNSVQLFAKWLYFGTVLYMTWPLHAGLPWIMALRLLYYMLHVGNSSSNAIWIMFLNSHIGFVSRLLEQQWDLWQQ